jgi:hypothetical protein
LTDIEASGGEGTLAGYQPLPAHRIFGKGHTTINDFIKFTAAADIPAFIPHTLGETPTESFVVLTMQGNRLGATLRVDTPFDADPAAYAQTLVSYPTADEAATGTILVIYTDENSSGNPRPYFEHVAALRAELDAAGVPLRDAWMVISEAWMNYL